MKSFNIKGRRIDCEIKRSRRRTVAIYVHPDKHVELRVPLFYNVDDVEPFILKHYRWLFKRLDAQETPKKEPKQFVTGELHYFLGEQYPLKIEAATRNSVTFINDVIHICCRDVSHTSVDISFLLDSWYFEQARAVFKRCAEPLIKQMSKYNVAPKSFTIKKMKTRWGSCSSKGSVNLNLDLIKLPEQCIKVVILHELCHLVHMNHSKDFYALMTAEMPDWKIWDKQLKFL